MPAYTKCGRCSKKFKVDLQLPVVCPHCNWPNAEVIVKKTKTKPNPNYSHASTISGSKTATEFRLTLPIPHSNNSEPKHIMAVYKYKEFWKQTAKDAWILAGSPFFGRVILSMHFYFPDKRKRDFTNYTGNWSIKGILDGLKENAFPDDSSNYLTLGGVSFGCDKENPRLELIFTKVEE